MCEVCDSSEREKRLGDSVGGCEGDRSGVSRDEVIDDVGNYFGWGMW